jgi:hypothetical protein
MIMAKPLKNGDRVHSTKIPGKLGRITDWQAKNDRTRTPERWLVSPEKQGELAVWLTRAEFQRAPESRPWL